MNQVGKYENYALVKAVSQLWVHTDVSLSGYELMMINMDERTAVAFAESYI